MFAAAGSGKARGSLNGAPFELSGELALESLPLGAFTPLVQDRLQRLSGRFSYHGTLAYTQDGDSSSIRQEGTSRVQSLDTAVKQPAITVGSKDLTVKSKLSLSTVDAARTLQLSSDIAVSDLDVVAENSRLALVRAALLKVSELSFEGTDRLSAGSSLAEKVELGRYADDTEQDAYMDVDRFEVSSLALADQLPSIDEVHYTGGRNHLRDSNNRISLKIPIEGDPANPDFDINDVLGKALATGVKKGALTCLTLALQPYGTLITAAKYAGETISKVRLNPVEFDPGQAALDDTDKDYLSKVATVMKERPQLAMKLCGVAVSADADRLQQQAAAARKSGEQGAAKTPAPEISETQLQALAKARADAVDDYLVSTFKTPADHLVGCRPRVEPGDAKAGSPRTDLLI